MAKVKDIKSPIMRSMAAVAGLFGNSAVPNAPVEKPLRAKENPFTFLQHFFKPKATKVYANKKLNDRKHQKFHQREGNSGRGALGARQRAVGVHWIKA